MRLQIKTFTQKTIIVEIEETETVKALKKRIHESTEPEFQYAPEDMRVIYAGQILQDDEKLEKYKIDESKPFVVLKMKVKEKIRETEKSPGETGPSTSAKRPCKLTPKEKQDRLVKSIADWGYSEEDVRRALKANSNNVERAIEYLIDGPPESPTTPESNASTSGANTSTSGANTSTSGANTSTSGTNTSDATLSPFEFLRTDPDFRRLKRSIMQNPQFLDTAIKRMGELNPQALHYVNENRQEFLTMLFESSDDDDDDDDDKKRKDGGRKQKRKK